MKSRYHYSPEQEDCSLRSRSVEGGRLYKDIFVNYAERISNHLEDLIELDWFAKELDNLMLEKVL